MNKNITIQGMSCVGCAKRLEDEISKLTGIEKANVNFANETLYIQYNEKLDLSNFPCIILYSSQSTFTCIVQFNSHNRTG